MNFFSNFGHSRIFDFGAKSYRLISKKHFLRGKICSWNRSTPTLRRGVGKVTFIRISKCLGVLTIWTQPFSGHSRIFDSGVKFEVKNSAKSPKITFFVLEAKKQISRAPAVPKQFFGLKNDFCHQKLLKNPFEIIKINHVFEVFRSFLKAGIYFCGALPA